MPEVLLRPCSYDYDILRPRVFELLDSLEGGKIIKCGTRVLIKPNLLAPASPDESVLTHPFVVKAAVEYVLSKGAHPSVGDSPALGSWGKIIRVSGLKAALDGLPVSLKEFQESVYVDIGDPFGSIELAREAVEAEVIINLPKLKTHAQLLLTGAVKNLFGCVVGMRKPRWHMQMGERKDLFARLLVQICRTLNPALTVVDGILAMEGEGPYRRGRPRKLGFLIAGNNPFSVDATVCQILGLKEDDLPTLREAKKMNIFSGSGERFYFSEPIRFELPPPARLIFGPPFLHGFLRKSFLERPVCNHALCGHCGDCFRFCPAEAMRIGGENKLVIDYDRCIRCFCCLEVCPQGAINIERPFLSRVLKRK